MTGSGPSDRPEDRPRQVHRQPRAAARPVVRVRRERVLSPLQAETVEGGRVDVEAVLLGHDRAAQGRATRASIAQADAHGVFAAARVGHGHAWEGLDARDDRGQAEGRMAVRPAYARQPRMPLPVDPRETAEGIGPQAVPAAGQTASHASEGTPVENARIVKVPAMRPKPTRFGVRLKRLRAKRRR